MIVRDMQKSVQQQLSAMDIPLVSEDVVHYLNRAQEQFIDEQYVLLRGKYTDEGNINLYQNSQQAIENLRTLVRTEQIGDTNISSVSHFDNADQFSLDDLTNEFYYYVRSQTQLADESGTAGGEWVNNKLIEQENVQKYVKTKFNDPIFRNYLVLIEGDSITVFYDSQEGAGVFDVALTYIKTPGRLVLESPGTDEVTESELPKHTHKDVVDLAVALIARDKSGTNPRLVEDQMEEQREQRNQQGSS